MQLTPGDPAPWFKTRSPTNPNFNFSTVAGRYVVLCFFGSAVLENSQRILADTIAGASVFDDDHASWFGISIDPSDESDGRVQQAIPGIRLFWDFDQTVSKLYKICPEEPDPSGNVAYTQYSIVLDPNLRVMEAFPFDDPATHAKTVIDYVAGLPRIGPGRPAQPQAPVLVVPRVFEPDLCRRLVGYYDAIGGTESGFMRDVEGKTTLIVDHGHKRRSDVTIEDESLKQLCQLHIRTRLLPEIAKATQFQVTRMERYIISCYDASVGGYFRPHRDNTTKGTAHRRFAVTLNLNADEYEGGNLRFPEYGRHTYRAETGGAVVFSCSMLHEALPVTDGKRYAFLPFLYDEAAARIRQQNLQHLDPAIAG